MNTIKVEQNAVDEVRACFDDCDRIIAGVQTNDKTIAWDGHLYLYKDSSCKKNSYYAKIPVQVKGVSCLEKHPDSINYSIDVADFKAYKDEGIAFFVVYVNSTNHAKTVYYTLLAPIEIKAIISTCSEQNSKSVSLQKLDCSNPNELDSIFRAFCDDCKRQKSFVDLPPLSFENLKELGNPELTVFGYANESEPISRLLTKNDFFIYADVGKESVKSLHPVGTSKCSISVSGVYNYPVMVGGKIFFNQYSVTNNRDEDILTVGNCLEITIPHANPIIQNVKVDFDGTKYCLSEAINELEFLLALAEEKHLCIAGCDFDMTQVAKEEAPVISGLLKLKAPYERLVKLKKALNILHVEKELDLKLLTEKDDRLIDVLITAFVDKKDVVESREVDFVTEIQVCNIVVVVTATKTSDNTYHVEDFFHSRLTLQGSIGDGTAYPVPQYSFLNKERVLRYSNIDFEQLLPSFKENILVNPNCIRLTNDLVMSLLLAYDDQSVKDNRLIDSAMELINWMIEIDTEKDHILNHRINYWQTKKRINQLDKEDKENLFELVECEASDEIKFAALLLLDEHALAMRYFERLCEEVKDSYRTSPIFHFVK